MFTKTGFGVLAAAGVAVGVLGMTMGGASGSPTTCVPSDSSAPSASSSGSSAADSAANANGTASATDASTANGANGAAGPLGPQGPGENGGNGSNGAGNGNGSDPLGNLPTGPSGASGATGANGLGGLHIDVHGDTTDATQGSATVTNNGSTVPNVSGSHHVPLLDLRARSNAPASGTNLSGTHVTARSSITGANPIISLHPGR